MGQSKRALSQNLESSKGWNERGNLGRFVSASFITLLILRTLYFSYSSDLRTMTERLKSGYFSSKKLFIADMMRIFTNCRTYNAPETEYYKCANTVERFFLSKVKELRKTWVSFSCCTGNTRRGKDVFSGISLLFKMTTALKCKVDRNQKDFSSKNIYWIERKWPKYCQL